MAVLAAGVIVMVLLSLLGNAGFGPSSEPSADGAYTVATVQVHAHKKVGASQQQFRARRDDAHRQAAHSAFAVMLLCRASRTSSSYPAESAATEARMRVLAEAGVDQRA